VITLRANLAIGAAVKRFVLSPALSKKLMQILHQLLPRYANSALTAACLLDSSLRAQYPEIDAALKEQAKAPVPANPKSMITPAQFAALISDPQGGPAMQESFISSVKAGDDPNQATQLVALLKNALETATADQKAALTSLMGRIGNLAADKPPVVTVEPLPIPVVSLLMDARLLLQEEPNTHKAEIESALEEFQDRKKHKLTPIILTELSEKLQKVDPAFQSSWQTQILKTYPWLDRMLPDKKEVTASR
jgi:hypothetical protein